MTTKTNNQTTNTNFAQGLGDKDPNYITIRVRRNSHIAILAGCYDGMCYPQLTNDIFEPELTFAQRLKGHIEFALTGQVGDPESITHHMVY